MKKGNKSYATSKWYFLARFQILFPWIHALFSSLVFFCIQVDWLLVVLQGSNVSFWDLSRHLQWLQGKGRRWGRDLKLHARNQGSVRSPRALVGWWQKDCFQMVRQNLWSSSLWSVLLGTLIPVFSLRDIFLFLFPIQFPSGKLIVYSTGVKSNGLQ